MVLENAIYKLRLIIVYKCTKSMNIKACHLKYEPFFVGHNLSSTDILHYLRQYFSYFI